MGQEMDYVGQVPDDELTLHVHPGADGRFVLYEDDGSSFDFEQGAFRTTEIRQEESGGQLRVELAGAAGTFQGAPEKRKLRFVVHGVGEPFRIELDGAPLRAEEGGDEPFWLCDEAASVVTVGVGWREAERGTVLAMASTNAQSQMTDARS
jgi:hypothetical protein